MPQPTKVGLQSRSPLLRRRHPRCLGEPPIGMPVSRRLTKKAKMLYTGLLKSSNTASPPVEEIRRGSSAQPPV